MSGFLNFFNSNKVDPSAGGPGVNAHLSPGGEQRSYFLQPDVKASSLSNTLSDLHVKGRSKSKDSNDVQYPIGYTPEVDYYVDKENKDSVTGYPIERGSVLSSGVVDKNGKPLYGLPRDTNDILEGDIIEAYDAFNDADNWEYLHHIDRGQIPIGVQLKANDFYLTSYVETDTNNEDPVSFGYDIIINYDNSPLFNGAIPDFINNFSSYKEISTRLDLYNDFKDQFFKFFNSDARNVLGYKQPRTYYLQKLVGLDNLTESISSDKYKQFIDYGKDFITLTLREDVSVNTGYLSALYKLLTWSKIHGKKMIPDNLLRFDMEIVVTESRKFNRVIKNSDSTLNQFADLISRYRYKLYECQFFFEKLSHGDNIDMTNLGYNDNYDIKFNYKYTNLLFEKFTDSESILVGGDIIREHIEVDNSLVDLSSIKPINTTNFTIVNNRIVLDPVDYVLKKYTPNGQSTTYNPIVLSKNSKITSTNTLDVLNSNSTNPDKYFAKLNNMSVPSTIKTVSNQNTLLQKTLISIQSSFKADVKRAIYSLKQDVLAFIPTNFLGGFTEDGYQYNIPAYYINKAFNTVNSTLRSTLGSIRRDIYEQKNIFVQTELMNINNFIDTGKNLLNNELGKMGGHYGSNPKNKPSNIYGNSAPTTLTYSGSNTSSDDAPLTPPHHPGTPFDIYEN